MSKSGPCVGRAVGIAGVGWRALPDPDVVRHGLLRPANPAGRPARAPAPRPSSAAADRRSRCRCRRRARRASHRSSASPRSPRRPDQTAARRPCSCARGCRRLRRCCTSSRPRRRSTASSAETLPLKRAAAVVGTAAANLFAGRGRRHVDAIAVDRRRAGDGRVRMRRRLCAPTARARCRRRPRTRWRVHHRNTRQSAWSIRWRWYGATVIAVRTDGARAIRPLDAAGLRVQRVHVARFARREQAAADDSRLRARGEHAGKAEGPFQLQPRHVRRRAGVACDGRLIARVARCPRPSRSTSARRDRSAAARSPCSVQRVAVGARDRRARSGTPPPPAARRRTAARPARACGRSTAP